MFRLFDILTLVFERLWQHRILVFWTLLGLSTATTLALSLTLYVDAVYSNLLDDQLGDPPYAFRFRYLGAWEGNISPQDVSSASASIHQEFAQSFGLPVLREAQYIGIGFWGVRSAENNLNIGNYSIGTLEGADAQIQIISGEWPVDSTSADEIPALISEELFYTTGLEVGDTLTATRSGGKTVTLKIAAMWRAVNVNDTSWMLPPKFFNEVLLVQPTDLNAMVEGNDSPIEEVDWYVLFDGTGLRTSDVQALLSNIINGERHVNATLPGIRLDISPKSGLESFNQEVNELRQQLVIVVLPVGGLIFYFVTMLSGMLVGRQQHEDVILSSRGMSRRALLRLHALMWLILAGIALGIGIFAAPSVVELVGRTTSFLRFDNATPDLSIQFTQQAVLLGTATGLIAASSGLLIAWRTTRQSITSFKQSQARAGKAWWQRMYLDMLLLIPAAYVFYNLNAEGGLQADAENPFSNPLVFLAPTLFSLGLTLLFLRLYPMLLNFGARIIGVTSSIALLMALRELTRSISRYRGALLMMCFTLSLTGFTASMASTLDRSLEDTINYEIGAPSVLVVASEAQTETTTNDSGEAEEELVGYNTLPASNLLAVEGIDNVSRVGRFSTQIMLNNQRISGTTLGIDRGALAAIAYFRDDYADESLPALLNKLAGNRTGILLNRETAETYHLLVGQEITMQYSALGETYQATVPIVGLLDYFPTLDPADGFFAITNLDPIFELVGTELPHDVWISLAPDADRDAVQAGVQAIGFPVLRWLDPQESLREAQLAPGRRGVLGFLSVGFVSSIVLTLVGSIIQSTASFRAQALQLGSLRAMGLGGGAVGEYLIFAQGIASSGGVIGGTLIGTATTLLFLPLLDFSGGLPPYLIRVAWDEITLVYGVFAGILIIVTLMTTVLLSREHLSALVKLGDA
ncbi:MAG: hypothetical protein BroJett018_14310 [Chloroflexota bacterium]|nr:hypothetical protein [Chloroflexota bacterium]NOG62980.1 hypothetical protein [Chloroflexota bacterium]GIK63637.1 MAG: hypothetical protein BroJett018_14310 [Chloroflexota bacterium]